MELYWQKPLIWGSHVRTNLDTIKLFVWKQRNRSHLYLSERSLLKVATKLLLSSRYNDFKYAFTLLFSPLLRIVATNWFIFRCPLTPDIFFRRLLMNLISSDICIARYFVSVQFSIKLRTETFYVMYKCALVSIIFISVSRRMT